MHSQAWLRVAVCGAWLCTGCTALREIPPSQYRARPERRYVRVITRDGLRYEFDYTRLEGDSLIGFRERDVEGPAGEVARLGVALDDVASLSAREVDWYRTGLIGGGALAAVAAAGLAVAAKNGNNGGDTSSGGGGRLP